MHKEKEGICVDCERTDIRRRLYGFPCPRIHLIKDIERVHWDTQWSLTAACA